MDKLEDNGGILNTIRKLTDVTPTYTNLDKDTLTKIMNKVFNRRIVQPMVLYTGYLGSILYNLAVLGMRMELPNYTVRLLGKYSKYRTVFNIGLTAYTYNNGTTKQFNRNHSNTKIYVNDKTNMFDVYQGVNFITSVKTIDEAMLQTINNKTTNLMIDLKPFDSTIGKTFRSIVKGNNPFTPDLLGYVKIKYGIAEITTGIGMSNNKIYGVTVVIDMKHNTNYSKCLHTLEEVSDYIDELNN